MGDSIVSNEEGAEAVDSVSTVNCWGQATSGNGKREIGGVSKTQSHANEILEPKKKRGAWPSEPGIW
jgi:hypothetical protein